MTYRDRREKALPAWIPLENPLPCETNAMKKRSSPVALRFHKVKEDNNPRRYMLNEVMLYYALTREVTLEEAEILYKDESYKT